MKVKLPKPWPILSIPNHGQTRWSRFCPPLSPKQRCSEPFASSGTLPKPFAFSSGLSKVFFPTQLSLTSSCHKFWVTIGTSTLPETCFFSIEKKFNETVKLEDRFFNTLIRSYAEAGLFKESLKLFQTMKFVAVSPSVVTFNSVLSILLKRGRTNMAKEVYDEMLHTYGVSPDTCTYNVLIRGLCKNSMVDEGFAPICT
ncbi:pentatricopeptide repeat-containing protein At1g02060, chloroplastic-like [Vigna radiata var. radiata]|uniref:Pentatricopeptide repeat-containing protein At1g02060, chloroplastic-like n=1 Tax=Vigna radiata var. radiata TaxID=3916 RepID=A0A1S3TZV4_VIGRR|nr:pentatricopeptide repeat-containing protein At1g02060, chloroplastic-like [Vigna radiata var. radiata]